MNKEKRHNLDAILQPTVEGMGFEYVGCELISQPAHSLLRVYLDKEGGLPVGECARVSHQLGAVLNVEDAMRGNYRLEVSSPGLERPLFNLAHFQRVVGQSVRIKLFSPLEQQSNFIGQLTAVEGEYLCLLAEGKEIKLPFSLVSKAKLIYQFADTKNKLRKKG